MIGGIILAVSSMIAGGILTFPGLFAGVGVGGIVAGMQTPDGDAGLLVFGGVFLAGALIPFVLMLLGIRRRVRLARLMTIGIPAIGTIRSIQDTGVTINDSPRVKVRVWIEPRDGSPPYQAFKTVTMRRVAPLMFGQRYPVLIGPTDRDKFALMFDLTDVDGLPPHVLELVALARESRARPDDPSESLVKLNELRMSGALTEAEFNAAKARILGR